MKRTTDIYYPTGEIEKTFINSIWHLSDSVLQERKEIILPKGTIEIIFNFSDKITYFNPSLQVSKKLPAVFINGINFKPFELTKTGRQEFVGMQLNSAGIKLLFNIPAREFNNAVYEGQEICSDFNMLADELYSKHLFCEQVEIILQWIRKKLNVSNYQYSLNRFQKLLSLKNHPNLSVRKLSEEMYLSDRQLRRFSQEWLGMNTEEFIIYQKYLKSLYLLHNPNLTLTEIGLEAGYYDQSHFIHHFKSYTDIQPNQYRKEQKGIPGHIYL